MGFDISNHPVDVAFIQTRLIPAIKGQADISDVLDRAAQHAAVAHRAKQWGLRVVALNSAIFSLQFEVSQAEPDAKPPMPDANGLWERLKRLGTTPAKNVKPQLRDITGLPGFDDDISVWGRPYFIASDNPRDALAVLAQYQACRGDDLTAIDQIALAQVAMIEARKDAIGSDVTAKAMAIAMQHYPLLAHLPPFDDPEAPVVADIRAHMAARLDLLQGIWNARHSDALLEHRLIEQPRPGKEMVDHLPLEVISMAAQVLPGWMGRGYVWPTALFDEIGVKVGHIFETPAPLFAGLLSEVPHLGERMTATINGNYSTGGYVPPEKIPAFRALLEKHRRELILAWIDKREVGTANVEALSADFNKIMEPVLLAERNGYGFIEGAEIYSGFMGVLN